MSYYCRYCQDIFPHYLDYFSCPCGLSYCNEECGDIEFVLENGETEETASCRVCRKEWQMKSVLLDYALKKLGVTLQQLTQMYYSEK